jgi:hypothetical protein
LNDWNGLRLSESVYFNAKKLRLSFLTMPILQSCVEESRSCTGLTRVAGYGYTDSFLGQGILPGAGRTLMLDFSQFLDPDDGSAKG